MESCGPLDVLKAFRVALQVIDSKMGLPQLPITESRLEIMRRYWAYCSSALGEELRVNQGRSTRRVRQ